MVTDLSIKKFLEFHETNDSMFTCLLTDSALGGAVPGTKDKPKKCTKIFLKNIIQIFRPRFCDFLTRNQPIALCGRWRWLRGCGKFARETLYQVPFSLKGTLNAILFSSPQVQLTAKCKDVHLYAIKRKALLALIKKKCIFLYNFSHFPYLGLILHSRLIWFPNCCMASFPIRRGNPLDWTNHTNALHINAQQKTVLPWLRSATTSEHILKRTKR